MIHFFTQHNVENDTNGTYIQYIKYINNIYKNLSYGFKVLTINLLFLQENQSKELAELLAQEDLGEMGLSSPSEQVAYLLVERATLLERLEAAERRLESQSVTDSLREVQHQVKG